MFPQHQQSVRLSTSGESKPSRLAGLHLMEVPAGTDIPALCAQLSHEEGIAWAEPYYLMEPLLVPDDPEARTGGRQDYLSVIKAYEAWDISRGDANTFIAVIDAGFEVDHPDLRGNRYFVTADPVNGVDDDGDGYTDTFGGYDLADDDTDVDAGPDPHGLEVAGISSAQTDNGIGLAGLGFDCPYYPLKIFRDSDNGFSRGYEAIVLAADLGAAVINLSWGGQGTGSQTLQEIINYAVLDRDVVVVAAAGNTGTEARFFPASYDNVLSVGASNDDDSKASFSSFSRYIDLLAPGNAIYSTRAGSTYGAVGGTSFAAPMVAATAALLRSVEPELSAIEVMERIRVSADDIYSVSNNADYAYQLGKGRLNMEAALSRNDLPSLRLADVDFNSSFGNLVFSMDTVRLDLSFINYLADAGATTVTLRALDENVMLLDSVINITGIAHNETVAASNSLHFYLGPDVAPGTDLEFLVLYEADGYSDFEYFDVPVVPDWLNFPGGDMLLTVSSHGNLGYEMDSLENGLGITRSGNTLLTFAGMGIAFDSNRVADNMPRSQDSLLYDSDFAKAENIRLWQNSLADNDARSSFYDEASAERDPIGVTVEQSVLSYAGEGDWIITEYRLINSGVDTLIAPAIGVYADWNIGNADNNRMESLLGRRMAYAWNSADSNAFAGISLLTRTTPIINAIELPAAGDRHFDDASKYAYLSGAVSATEAGMTGSGADVALFLSAKADTLYPGESTYMAFAWLAADDLDALISQRDRAQAHYDAYRESPPRLDTVFVCAGQEATIDPAEGDFYSFYSDPAGENLLSTGLSLDAGILQSDTVFYVENRDWDYPDAIRSMPVKALQTSTAITASLDTLYLGDQPANSIRFGTIDDGAVTWDWTFSNGFSSQAAMPEIVFEGAGTYTATVYTATTQGCLDTATYMVAVIERPDAPQVQDTTICSGTSLQIDPANADLIRVYDAASGGTVLFDGLVFATGAITSEQTFYFSRFDASGVESPRAAMRVQVRAPEAGIAFAYDTLDLSNPNLVLLIARGEGYNSLLWDSGNGESGTESTFAATYTAPGEYDVQLSVTDSAGCTATVSRVLAVASSTSPVSFPVLPVCSGDASLMGNGVDVYHYYTTDGSTLLYKGRYHQLPELRKDTAFLVANNAAFAESEKLLYDLSIRRYTSTVVPDPDTVYWDGRPVEVNVTLEAALSLRYEWWLSGVATGQTGPLQFTVDGPGVWLIEAVTFDEFNCPDTARYSLPSIDVTALASEPGQSQWKVWPNPGSTLFHLKGPPEKLDSGTAPMLLTASGASLGPVPYSRSGEELILDLSAYPPGLYLLKPDTESTPIRLLILR